VGGTAEILTDQVSALLVAPDDVEALTAAIRRMLTDRQLSMRLGQHARMDAIEKFSLSAATAGVSMFWKSFL
jgi:glycosyltransferase involved in cell wall biosynthesis